MQFIVITPDYNYEKTFDQGQDRMYFISLSWESSHPVLAGHFLYVET